MKTAQIKNSLRLHKGFTLIELLIVIGILAVLMGIVLVAINPSKQFKQANDTKRRADVNAILNSISQYQADNHGALPTGIPVAPSTAAEIASGAGNADLCSILAPRYVAAMPSDPLSPAGGNPISDCSSYDTGYTVVNTGVANSSRVTVNAPLFEGTAPISVTR